MRSTYGLLFLLPLLVGCGSFYSSPLVLIGDSITAQWSSNADFRELGWIEKGIPGQNSHEIEQRFESDVLELHPISVHILAGTNDLYPGWVPQNTYSALGDMISRAKTANIKVYIGTVPPWGQGSVAATLDPDYIAHSERVVQLNSWIRAQSGVEVIDYYKLLVDKNSFYQAAMTNDGVHPNNAGFRTMTPVLQSLVTDETYIR